MSDDILLVDDDPGTIQLLGRILSGSGNLRFATSGEDALRLARESPPDLMLLDAEMPGMGGFAVCKELKSEPTLAAVSVIFLTSHNDAAFEVAGFDMGAADFIGKPINAQLHVGSTTAQHVTVSVGVACYDDESECWTAPSAGVRTSDEPRARCSPMDLVLAADQALYSAKDAGRGQARLLDIANVDKPELARAVCVAPQ